MTPSPQLLAGDAKTRRDDGMLEEASNHPAPVICAICSSPLMGFSVGLLFVMLLRAGPKPTDVSESQG